MGFSKKHQIEVTKESEGKKWVIAGIGIRAPLKPISTKVKGDSGGGGDDEEESSTTPTARESRIPEILTCPPPPRKRRPVSTCQVVRDFFVPPDLESVFVCNAERAN